MKWLQATLEPSTVQAQNRQWDWTREQAVHFRPVTSRSAFPGLPSLPISHHEGNWFSFQRWVKAALHGQAVLPRQPLPLSRRRAHCNCSSEVSTSCTHPPQFSSHLSILQDSINKNVCFQTLRQGPLMVKMPCLGTLWERRSLQSPGKTLDTFQQSSYLWLNMPEYKSRETDNYSENQAGKVHFSSGRDRKGPGNPRSHLDPEPQAAAQDRSLVCFVSGIGSFLPQGQPASLCYSTEWPPFSNGALPILTQGNRKQTEREPLPQWCWLQGSQMFS